MKQSNFLSLNFGDFGKGLLMAILTPALVIIQQSLDLGVLTFEWKSIIVASVAGGLAYLTKNFFTSSKVQSFADTPEDNELIGTRPPKKNPNA